MINLSEYQNGVIAPVSTDGIQTLTNKTIVAPLGIVKANVGLGNVDNTSDVNKPVSTLQQAALNAKQNTLVSGTSIKTVGGASLLGSGDISVGSAVVVVAGTTQTAVAGTHYVLTDVATTTVTLPAAPALGNKVSITVRNSLYGNVIARNGLLIMGLAEDLIINQNNASFSLVYADAARGWVLI
jgi:hypothetical protein